MGCASSGGPSWRSGAGRSDGELRYPGGVSRLRLCLVLLIAAGCRGRNLASSLAQTPGIDAQGQARCGVMKSYDAPLIIEWPSADRGALEGLIIGRRDGLVAVRYEGCEMQLLRRCSVAGGYGYTGLGIKHDDQTFRSADELYAKIPLGAAQLEGELERHGALALKMTVVGRFDAGHARVDRRELRGDCEQATHVISAATVGAFRLATEAGAEVAAGGGFYNAQAGVSSSAERGFERSDGDPQRCSGNDSSRPPSGCGALLRLEVEPIREPDEVSARRKQRPCPRGTVLVEGGRYGWEAYPRPMDVHMPPEIVVVPDFCIDQHEVIAADYADCADDGPCSAAATTVHGESLPEIQLATEGDLCNGDRVTRRRHPVNCVTWHQADTYCRARGGRLPSEQEWEWAARGGEQQRTYAWGEEKPGPDLVNACDGECTRYLAEKDKKAWTGLFAGKDGDAGTAKTGSHRRGAGRGRVLDLAGNVWEWTASSEAAYRGASATYEGGGEAVGGPAPDLRAIRGGGFMSEEDDEVRVTARRLLGAKDRRTDVGFRCVRDP